LGAWQTLWMRTRSRFDIGFAFAATLVTLLAAPSARAHFKLEEPADRLQTDDNGDPLGAGGTQKVNPCGDGTPSGLITQVTSGSVLHIKVIETVPHGGHYRVAIVPKLDPVNADMPEPDVTLDGAGQCASATIESPVSAPVIADGLFPHTQATAVSGQIWETDVQLPSIVGDATLQVLEFMTPHAPECFYHHCAELRMLAAPEAGAPDAGAPEDGGAVVITKDGGVVVTDAGHGAGAGRDSGANGDAAGSSDDGRCNAGAGATPSVVTMGAFGLALASMLRRRRSTFPASP